MHSNEDYVIAENEEICGFGSGDFAKSAEANDIMSDCNGRWALFDLSGKASDAWVVLEHSRKLPEHLRELAIFNKARQVIVWSTQWCILNCPECTFW